MVFIIFILLICFLILTFYKTKRSLHMIQQNLYNENNRYLKWILNNKKQFIDFELLIIVIAFFFFFF